MDYYRVLEITEQADEEQIKQAYRRLAKKYHPDLNQGNPEAEEKFKDIAKAYEVLGDAAMRKAYDSKRRTPVIYGNPPRSKSECSRDAHSKTEHNKSRFCRNENMKTGSDKTEHNKAKYNKAEYDKTEQSKQEHEEHQDDSTETKENKTDFTMDLERYFGFSFEEGKKVVKEQESQEEQEDSLELAEIFQMFMKMK